MNDYISSGLDKDLVDPDGGVNAEKKKAELGLLSKNKDNVLLELKQFPDKGFEVGLSRIPTIGYSQIVTCIRPVLEYACLVFHHSLPQYLSNEMERLQKSALRIMQPDLSYAEALVALDITSLYERRKALSNALFDQIVADSFFFFLNNRLFTIKARYIQSSDTKLSKYIKPELAASCSYTQWTRHRCIRTERTHLRYPKVTDTAFRARLNDRENRV